MQNYISKTGIKQTEKEENMKQSIIKKNIAVNGKNGINTADIIITMNFGTKNTNVHNPSTHDDLIVPVSTHKIEVFIDNKLWKSVKDITSENMLLNETETMVEKTKEHLEFLSNAEPEKSFLDKLNDILNK